MCATCPVSVRGRTHKEQTADMSFIAALDLKQPVVVLGDDALVFVICFLKTDDLHEFLFAHSDVNRSDPHQ